MTAPVPPARIRASFGGIRSRRAFTLIEVLVAIALIAILAGMVVGGSGMLGTARLRQSAALVVSCVRMANSWSTATGKTMRLVFDFDSGAVNIEVSNDAMLRVKDTGDKKESEGAAAGAEPASSAEQEALAYADSIVKAPHAPRAKFETIKKFAEDHPDGLPFGGNVKFRSVQTEHDAKPRKEGRAYLYFWPGGQTERAAIQLQRNDDDNAVLTVIVNALTGRAHIERGEVSLEPDARSDEKGDFGEREEE